MFVLADVLVNVYVAYTVVAVALITWLAYTLFRNGALFLEDVFPDNHALAAAVNRLLVTGFFMVNLGFAFFLLKSNDVTTTRGGIETLAQKLGILLVLLAAMHFANMYVLNKMRHRRDTDVPPVPADRIVPVPPGTDPQARAAQEWADYERRKAAWEAQQAAAEVGVGAGHGNEEG